MFSEPLLQILAYGKKHAAEDAVLPHECFQFRPLCPRTLGRAHENLGRESVRGEVTSHLADSLVGTLRDVRNRLGRDQDDQLAAATAPGARLGEQAIATALSNFQQAFLRQQVQSGADGGATDLE